MLIRDTAWKLIREHFSEDEKRALRRAANGQVICPAGVTVDVEELSADLREKLQRTLRAAGPC